MKLLIVDDQRSVHLCIQEVIDLPSLKVSKVQHAESSRMQALELLRRCHLDLMILDIQIIDMNGVALAEVLRQEKIVYSETVVLTIYNEFLYAERYIDFGVRRYVFKPIGTVALTLILCETYQVVYQHRLESYRRAFLLLCSHLNDMCTLQVRHIDPVLYGVICISERNEKYSVVMALETISCCTVDGFTILLVSIPSQKYVSGRLVNYPMSLPLRSCLCDRFKSASRRNDFSCERSRSENGAKLLYLLRPQ